MRKQTLATYVILAINIIVYLAIEMRGGPTYENLIRYGAKENGLIAVGQWYRLITPMFLHSGLMHLGFNMYALFQVGRVLEFMIGSRNFLAVYFFGGITASLCSFALSPALSVGASGSLYALLLALYMLQRYEAKIARELGLGHVKSPLGTLIIINGLITFVIPNIDWAAHLGGAIAGALLGQAFVLRHIWRSRIERCRKFLDPYSAMPRRSFAQRHRIYFVALALLNLGFSAKYVLITDVEKAFGLGMLEASQTVEGTRDRREIRQFGKLFTSAKSEANPLKLAHIALRLHQQGLYMPAFLTYHSALLIAEETKQSVSLTDRVSIQSLTLSAYNSEPPQAAVLELFHEQDEFETLREGELSAECIRAAELLASLRIYEVSAKLFESAYLQKPEVLRYAVLTFASLKKVDDLSELFRFRSFVEFVESGSIWPLSKKPFERLFGLNFLNLESLKMPKRRELTEQEKMAVILKLRPADYWTWGAAPDSKENAPDLSEPLDRDQDIENNLPPI